jgi:hypothetical protein
MLVKHYLGRIIVSYFVLNFIWINLIYILATLFLGWNISGELVILYSLLHASYTIPIVLIFQYLIYKLLFKFYYPLYVASFSSLLIISIIMILYYLLDSYLGIGGWIMLVFYGVIWNEVFIWLVDIGKEK